MVKILSNRLRYILVLIFGILIGVLVAHGYYQSQNRLLIESIVVEHELKDIVTATDELHILKIGENKLLVDNLEEEIIDLVKVLNSLYPMSSDIQKSEIESSFRLLFVFNEKFDFDKWKKDGDFLRVLEDASKSNVKNIQWLRRQDWSKPMWMNEAGSNDD